MDAGRSDARPRPRHGRSARTRHRPRSRPSGTRWPCGRVGRFVPPCHTVARGRRAGDHDPACRRTFPTLSHRSVAIEKSTIRLVNPVRESPRDGRTAEAGRLEQAARSASTPRIESFLCGARSGRTFVIGRTNRSGATGTGTVCGCVLGKRRVNARKRSQSLAEPVPMPSWRTLSSVRMDASAPGRPARSCNCPRLSPRGVRFPACECGDASRKMSH